MILYTRCNKIPTPRSFSFQRYLSSTALIFCLCCSHDLPGGSSERSTSSVHAANISIRCIGSRIRGREARDKNADHNNTTSVTHAADRRGDVTLCKFQRLSVMTGASKGTPTQNASQKSSGGTKIRKLGGQSLKLLPPDVIF